MAMPLQTSWTSPPLQLYTATVPLQPRSVKENVSTCQQLFQQLLEYCTVAVFKCKEILKGRTSQTALCGMIMAFMKVIYYESVLLS